MMTLYKLEEEQFQSHVQEHYLPEYIEDLVLMNRPILEARGVSIEQAVDEDLLWEFDGTLVSGVLSSIFANVIRYSDGQVRISAETVRISAETGVRRSSAIR